MKKQFSTNWRASKRPGKQRKYAAQAPRHLKRKFLSVNLSKELRKKHGRRSLPLRKDDVVRVMRGKFKGKTGKVLAVNGKRLRVEVEGIQIKKQDGSKANIRLIPQLLQITELNTEDKRRGIKTKEKIIENRSEKQENAS